MKLYNFSWGPYPRRITLYLAEKGIADIKLVDVEFPHKPERWPPGFLRSLNPAGSLPVLDVGDGTMVRQSLAILEYLEERHPSPNMIGRTAEARALTREFVSVFDEATSFFGIWARQGSHLNVERHKPSAEAAAVGAERFASKLRVAEEMMGTGLLLTGDSVTIADIVAMALLEFTHGFYGVSMPSGLPKLTNWYERFSRRPSAPPITYPADELNVAYGLPQQTQISV